MKNATIKEIFAGHRDGDDDGGVFIFGLYIFIAMAMIAGIAIDVAHLNAERARLQYTTDLVAHAALYNRDSQSSFDAVTAALAVVETVMPASELGTLLTADDFHFGAHDYVSNCFVNGSTVLNAAVARHAGKRPATTRLAI